MTTGEPISMYGETGIMFVVQSDVTGVLSQAWSINTRSTSFYLTPLSKPLAVKLSLHGPDERPGLSRPGFKLDVVPDSYSKAVAAGVVVLDFNNYLPKWFTGISVNDTTTHVVRFLYRTALFTSEVHTFPPPELSKSATIHSRIPAPTEDDDAVYVDIYVATGKPYFGHDEAATRRENAGIGPMVNTARQYLTVVARKVDYSADEDPFSTDYTSSEGIEGEVQRVTGMKVDDNGLMWINEVMMPRSLLENPKYQYKPPPKTKPQTDSQFGR